MFESEGQKIAHLLRRFGFGASEAEVAYYGRNGLQGAIDLLLNYESVDEGFSVDPMSLANAKNANLKVPAVQHWWLMRMLSTRRPLQEKMTLFWHDHFATSADKVSSPYMMLAQNEIFRAGATGSFRDLLLRVSKDPAMLLWLDNDTNVRGHPNENFAREVMELFTLGIGHYSERDIQEGARAFTGWAFGTPGARRQAKNKAGRNQVFIDREAEHDSGPKEFLGRHGDFNGDAVIDILCEQPRTADYLTAKLWEWFAYPNPSPDLIARLSRPFQASQLDIKALLRSIMESPEFYSTKAYLSLYKNPIDFTVSTLRQLGFGSQALDDTNYQSDQRPAIALRIATKAMGMDLLYPPDVSGWDGGASWVTSATMVARIQWASTIFGQSQIALKNKQFTIGCDAQPLFESDPSPRGIATRLVTLFDASLPEQRLTQLVEAAKTVTATNGTRPNANDAAWAVARLIFAAPEFQFC